ncbi:MAG: helix-turn-helix transcriptional regulator [Clostridiales bacterium]|nr:helix-turn-helix transcriptional regulator [Clostridiales bacterium]
MASKKVGTLIKEARTGADLTQEQLARKISGLSANDISLAERGQKELTQAQLKQIAKVTGVTQASLINAAKGSSSAKSSTAKKATTAKKTTATAKKTTSSSGAKTSSIKVTATEKKLLELYREADSETKKSVMSMLKGEEDATDSVLENILSVVQDMLQDGK